MMLLLVLFLSIPCFKLNQVEEKGNQLFISNFSILQKLDIKKITTIKPYFLFFYKIHTIDKAFIFLPKLSDVSFFFITSISIRKIKEKNYN